MFLLLAAVVSLYALSLVIRLFLRPLTRESASRGPCKELVVIVPALREQACIGETLRDLSLVEVDDVLVKVVVVTTELESRQPSPGHQTSTATIVDQTIAELNGNERRFTRIHYPYTTGVMAHQINYAARYLFEAFDCEINPDSTVVAVFNADSRPTQAVLREGVYAASSAAPIHQAGSLYCLRQRGSSLSTSIVCGAAALWQTRWSLGVEYYRGLFGSRLASGRAPSWLSSLLTPFNYVVGHGLFIRLREFIEVNYMPEYTPNEDAAMSFVLPFYGLAPRPLSGLDRAEVPNSIRELAKQQSSWILGPAHALAYASYSLRSGLVPKKRALILPTVKALWDACVWILGPLLFSASIVLVLAGYTQALPLLWALFLYTTIPNLTLIRHAKQIFPGTARPVTWFALSTIAMPVWYLIHGFAGTWGLLRSLYFAVTDRSFVKVKTERNY